MERARVDRTGSQFSLVLFDTGNSDNGVPQRISQILEARLRITDEVGWFDKLQVGVIMPDTTAQGAWKLAEDVCQSVFDDFRSPFCSVYTYPSDWLSKKFEENPSGDSFKTDDPSNDNAKNNSKKCKTPLDYRYNCRMLKGSLAPRNPYWKRGIDVLGAVVLLILFFPLFLMIGVLIKIVSPGPIFFKQKRVGYQGKFFDCLKFRTMTVNADTSVHEQYVCQLTCSETPMTKLDMEEDARIIPFGNLLRITALDELPQLINIIRGEMSLIGPRPCLPYEARNYQIWQRKRFHAMPGLTGFWQVNGKNRTTFKEMIRMDIRYVKEMSLWLDMKILIGTIPAVFTQVAQYMAEKRAN
ncbi:MAG: sugar transferase [Desulfobacterales bacterium]|jgi:lipopolysaccharide/colanic/teichoic acid biosynthesis glycosyltransferase